MNNVGFKPAQQQVGFSGIKFKSTELLAQMPEKFIKSMGKTLDELPQALVNSSRDTVTIIGDERNTQCRIAITRKLKDSTVALLKKANIASSGLNLKEGTMSYPWISQVSSCKNSSVLRKEIIRIGKSTGDLYKSIIESARSVLSQQRATARNEKVLDSLISKYS